MKAEVIIESNFEIHIRQPITLPNTPSQRLQIWEGAIGYKNHIPLEEAKKSKNRYWQRGYGLAASRVIEVIPR